MRKALLNTTAIAATLLTGLVANAAVIGFAVHR